MWHPWGCFMSTWNVRANLPKGWSPPHTKKPFSAEWVAPARTHWATHHPTLLRRTAEPQSASDRGRLMLSIKSDLWTRIIQASYSWSDRWTGIAHLAPADALANEGCLHTMETCGRNWKPSALLCFVVVVFFLFNIEKCVFHIVFVRHKCISVASLISFVRITIWRWKMRHKPSWLSATNRRRRNNSNSTSKMSKRTNKGLLLQLGAD